MHLLLALPDGHPRRRPAGAASPPPCTRCAVGVALARAVPIATASWPGRLCAVVARRRQRWPRGRPRPLSGRRGTARQRMEWVGLAAGRGRRGRPGGHRPGRPHWPPADPGPGPSRSRAWCRSRSVGQHVLSKAVARVDRLLDPHRVAGRPDRRWSWPSTPWSCWRSAARRKAPSDPCCSSRWARRRLAALSGPPPASWLSDAVNRIVYGERSSPDESLRTWGTRLTRAIPMDELLLQLAESLRKTMTLVSAEVWTGADGHYEWATGVPAPGAAPAAASARRSARWSPGPASQDGRWLEIWLRQPPRRPPELSGPGGPARPPG